MSEEKNLQGYNLRSNSDGRFRVSPSMWIEGETICWIEEAEPEMKDVTPQEPEIKQLDHFADIGK